MTAPEVQLSELVALAADRRLSTVFGVARDRPAIVVHLTDGTDDPAQLQQAALHELGTLPAVIVGVGRADHPASCLVDVIVDPELPSADFASITDAVAHRPLASVALCLLLRHGHQRSIAAGLVAESTTYSMLQGGPEFARWIDQRPPVARVANAEPPVVVEDDGDTVTISLSRPHRHNAVDVELSELLVDALTDVLSEPARRVVLRGNGPSFSSGGDLAEFGGFTDPVSAHAVRLSRSAGQLIAMMSDRVQARLHGICFGAGIELPAFAGDVVSSPDARIALPELSLGLVPGAGGTVSLVRRIGRHRTALLALTGTEIDVATAHRWGLVDRVEPA